ncbi:hypothetical protein [Acidovorax sp.]|jgi:hypothetical protein|uniref:hypothetical protein n=1 Tax=Acidovorax sp. TaxID=1872122 RepID=UPI00391F9E7F
MGTLIGNTLQRLTPDVLRAAAQSAAAQHIPLAEANHHEPGTVLWAQFNEAYAACLGQEAA